MTKDEDANAALVHAVGKSTEATQAATEAMKNALQALPNLLAAALAQNAPGAGAAAAAGGVGGGGQAAATPTTKELRRVPDSGSTIPGRGS